MDHRQQTKVEDSTSTQAIISPTHFQHWQGNSAAATHCFNQYLHNNNLDKMSPKIQSAFWYPLEFRGMWKSRSIGT